MRNGLRSTTSDFYTALFYGAFTLALSMAVSACRLGNYTEAPKPLTTPTSAVSTNSRTGSLQNVELFYAEPKTLQTFAIYKDATPPSQNNSVGLVSIPSDVLNTFTDPTYLAWTPDSTHTLKPYFLGVYNPGSNNFPTTINSAGAINAGYSDASVTIATGCSMTDQRLHVGKLDRHQLGSYTFPDGTVQTVSGHLKFDYTFMRVFTETVAGSGACGAYLQTLANCFNAGSTCTNDQLTAAHEIFDLWIRQSSVLPIANATKLKGLAYVVHFE
jgi:hypothetical protein